MIIFLRLLFSSIVFFLANNNSNATAVDEYDETITSLQRSYLVPVVGIAVLDGNSVHIKRTSFTRNDKGNQKSLFNVGSISKTVTALAVLKLHEDKLLDINKPVEDYLKRWKLPPSDFDSSKVTIASLLNHTSGLTMWGVPEFKINEDLPTIVKMLNNETDGVLDIRLENQPQSLWQYSGGGYAALQLLIEEVTETPFAQYMEKEILPKLGMSDASFLLDKEVIEKSYQPYDGAGKKQDRLNFTAVSAAGLNASLDDLVALAKQSMGTAENMLVEKSTLNLMKLTTETAPGYGFGYQVFKVNGEVFFGHSGQNEGWMSSMFISAVSQKALIVLTNGTNGIRIIQDVEGLWLCSEFKIDCPYEPTLPIELETERLTNYAGDYESEAEEISLNSDGTHLYWETDYGYEFALRATSQNVLYFVGGSTTLTFSKSPNGVVDGFIRIRGENETKFSKKR